MIYKPYALSPSYLMPDGENVYMAGDNAVHFLVRGDEPIKYCCPQIKRNNDTVLAAITTITGPYIDSDGNPVQITAALDQDLLYGSSNVGFGNTFSWRMLLWGEYWQDEEHCTAENADVYSNWVTCKYMPKLVLTVTNVASTITQRLNTWTASVTYNAGGFPPSIRYQRWQITDTTDDIVVYDTGNVYGYRALSCEFDGLVSGHSYTATVTYCDSFGTSKTVTSTARAVSYTDTNDTGAISTTFQPNGSVKIDLRNYVGIRGEAETDNYSLLSNTPAVDKTSLSVGNGNSVIWDTGNSALSQGTYRVSAQVRLTTANLGGAILDVNPGRSGNTLILIGINVVAGLTPSSTLTPSATLTPRDPKYYVEYAVDRGTASSYSSSVLLEGLSAAPNWYYIECIFTWDMTYPTVTSLTATKI